MSGRDEPRIVLSKLKYHKAWKLQYRLMSPGQCHTYNPSGSGCLQVPLVKQHADFQHPAIELYILKKKKGASVANLLQLEVKEAADLAEALEGLTLLSGAAPSAAAAEGDDIADVAAAGIAGAAAGGAEGGMQTTSTAANTLGTEGQGGGVLEQAAAGGRGEDVGLQQGSIRQQQQQEEQQGSHGLDAAAELLLSAAAAAAVGPSVVADAAASGAACSSSRATAGCSSSCHSSMGDPSASDYRQGSCQGVGEGSGGRGTAGCCGCSDDMEVDGDDDGRNGGEQLQAREGAVGGCCGGEAAECTTKAGAASGVGVASGGSCSIGACDTSTGRQLSFEERRQGAMAARLLAGVQLPGTAVQQHATL